MNKGYVHIQPRKTGGGHPERLHGPTQVPASRHGGSCNKAARFGRMKACRKAPSAGAERLPSIPSDLPRRWKAASTLPRAPHAHPDAFNQSRQEGGKFI